MIGEVEAAESRPSPRTVGTRHAGGKRERECREDGTHREGNKLTEGV